MRKFLLMPSRKVAWVAGLALIAWLLTPLAAFAHPLGNFTVNHYSRLEIYSDRVRVRYVLDMAEIPTFQAMPDIDRDGSGQVSQAENERYRLEQFEALRRGLRLEVNGAPVELQTATSELSFPPGQGDLKTLRLSGWLEAPLSSAVGQSATIEFEDHNFTDRIGWREIVVRPADGIRLDQSDAPMQEVSDELRAYPEDMLSSPLTQRQASLRFQIMFASSAPPLPGAAKPASSAAARTTDPFARLIHIEDLSASVALFALVAALGWGAAHAFTPGHGKALVGAYLVGARGTPRHAILLGLTVTATHTLGVYVLGFVTLFASRYILPEKLYPVLGVISGVMVVAIGGSLFVNRLRGQGGHAHAHDHHHPDHEHDHHHDHNHHHGPHSHTLI
ncbi:MAG: nickel/cobalt transporter, partial [Anaerolineales bacterium]